MKRIWSFVLVVIIFVSCNDKKQTSHNHSVKSLQNAQLFATLPEYCPTPDAFALAPDGSLTLSCPNYATRSVVPVLVSIDKEGRVSKLGSLPGLKDGKYARPVGIVYGPDGALYTCDNQGLNKSRVLRTTFKEGKIDTTVVIAQNLSSPNGIKYNEGYVYVTQPRLPKFNTPKLTSGVYRFKTTDREVEVNNDSTDTMLIFSVQTQNPRRQFGLDGLEFDKKGNLLVGDFGDGIIYQLKIADDGNIVKTSVFSKLPNSSGIDGMFMAKDGTLYVAGLCKNQVWKVFPDGNNELIAEYPDNNGANGDIDQPADVVVFDDKLVISNFDLMTDSGMVNTSHDLPYTLSFIQIDK